MKVMAHGVISIILRGLLLSGCVLVLGCQATPNDNAQIGGQNASKPVNAPPANNAGMPKTSGPCLSPPVVDTRPLIPLLRKQGLITKGMTNAQQQQAIRDYIRARQKRYRACAKNKPPKSQKSPDS